MSALRVEPGARLAGLARPPPDKSISHRALLFAALGEGEAVVEPLSGGADNRATLSALSALGVRVVDEGHRARILGVGGPRGLTAPAAPIDCANSGTTMRLLAGIGAAMQGKLTLTGDASLSGRPMSRLRPLESMGARLAGVEREGRLYPPITIEGGALVGRTHHLPIASAQIKSALLLAGLWAEGETIVYEPERSRDHTERMLAALGAPIETLADGGIRVRGVDRPWRAARFEVAPDMSSAAFLLAAAFLTGSDELTVETAVNPTRTGFLDAIEALGAVLEREERPPIGGEPVARIRVIGGAPRGAEIRGALSLRAIDEIPILAGIAAFAPGTTVIGDAAELRVKESDRLRAMAGLLAAFGAEVEERPDGLVITGRPLRGAKIDAGHDHRIGLTAAVMGLAAPGYTEVAGADIIGVSYPGFAEVLRSLGGRVRG